LGHPSLECRRVAADALVELGPTAREQVAQAAEGPDPAERTGAEAILKRVKENEARFGVRDAAERLSQLAVKEAYAGARALAREHRIELIAETDADAAASPIEDRSVAANGLLLRITKSPYRVEVVVGEGLRRRGFDADQAARLKETVSAALADRDFDRGLKDAVRFLVAFAANASGKPAPAADPKP
jgi:hypothetical protein